MSPSCIMELIIFCNKPKGEIYLTINSSYTNLYSYKKTSIRTQKYVIVTILYIKVGTARKVEAYFSFKYWRPQP